MIHDNTIVCLPYFKVRLVYLILKLNYNFLSSRKVIILLYIKNKLRKHKYKINCRILLYMRILFCNDNVISIWANQETFDKKWHIFMINISINTIYVLKWITVTYLEIGILTNMLSSYIYIFFFSHINSVLIMFTVHTSITQNKFFGVGKIFVYFCNWYFHIILQA